MIEIWDAGVGLADVLRAVPSVDQLSWSILEFGGIARDESLDAVALEQQVDASGNGVRLTPGELRQLADQLFQLVDGVVVGYDGDPPQRTVADLRGHAEVVIEAIDSTFWRVYASDRAVIDEIGRAYEDVRPVDPEVPLRPHTIGR